MYERVKCENTQTANMIHQSAAYPTERRRRAEAQVAEEGVGVHQTAARGLHGRAQQLVVGEVEEGGAALYRIAMSGIGLASGKSLLRYRSRGCGADQVEQSRVE